MLALLKSVICVLFRRFVAGSVEQASQLPRPRECSLGAVRVVSDCPFPVAKLHILAPILFIRATKRKRSERPSTQQTPPPVESGPRDEVVGSNGANFA